MDDAESKREKEERKKIDRKKKETYGGRTEKKKPNPMLHT